MSMSRSGKGGQRKPPGKSVQVLAAGSWAGVHWKEKGPKDMDGPCSVSHCVCVTLGGDSLDGL